VASLPLRGALATIHHGDMATLAKRRLRLQARATPDDGPGSFSATVSAYNLAYDVGWGWTELILPGAFADAVVRHPAIPTFYEHDWAAGPIGVCSPTEGPQALSVAGHLYLELSERARVIYQGMLDGALEEWSVAFWPETIVSEDDKPLCDQIAKGDLAEASVCVRGVNPGTETVDLRSQPGWIVGDEGQRQREVVRLRSLCERADVAPDTECSNCGHLASVHNDTDDGDNAGACSAPGCDCSGMDEKTSAGAPPCDSLSHDQEARGISAPWAREFQRLRSSRGAA